MAKAKAKGPAKKKPAKKTMPTKPATMQALEEFDLGPIYVALNRKKKHGSVLQKDVITYFAITAPHGKTFHDDVAVTTANPNWGLKSAQPLPSGKTLIVKAKFLGGSHLKGGKARSASDTNDLDITVTNDPTMSTDPWIGNATFTVVEIEFDPTGNFTPDP